MQAWQSQNSGPASIRDQHLNIIHMRLITLCEVCNRNGSQSVAVWIWLRRILWDTMTYTCLRYLLLTLKSAYEEDHQCLSSFLTGCWKQVHMLRSVHILWFPLSIYLRITYIDTCLSSSGEQSLSQPYKTTSLGFKRWIWLVPFLLAHCLMSP